MTIKLASNILTQKELRGMGQAANTCFPVKAITRGLGTDLWYYEPTANATFRVVWLLIQYDKKSSHHMIITIITS